MGTTEERRLSESQLEVCSGHKEPGLAQGVLIVTTLAWTEANFVSYDFIFEETDGCLQK